MTDMQNPSPLSLEDWWTQFKPQPNTFDPHASGPMVTIGDDNAGRLFGCDGKDHDFVLSVLNSEPGRVWTLVDTDGNQSIASGYHRVNREGYYVTEVAFTGSFLEIDLSDDLTERYAVYVDDENVFDGTLDSYESALVAGIKYSLEADEDEQIEIVRLQIDGDEDDEPFNTDVFTESSAADALREFAEEAILGEIDWSEATRRNETSLDYESWVKQEVDNRFADFGINVIKTSHASSPKP